MLHLIKLCVGVSAIEEMQAWVDNKRGENLRLGRAVEHIHTTRMAPKRADELLDGGSLYWVIKGNVQARQKLIDIRPFTDGQGIRRCHLVMESKLVPTRWQPRRAFQGWRYLKAEDAPADLDGGAGDLTALPPDLRLQLADLGLL